MKKIYIKKMQSKVTGQKTLSNYERLKAERARQMAEKEKTIQTVLDSAKGKLKFIHLIIYCLNSIEKFISPPNREIRVNAKIIIRLEGVSTLRAIALVNCNNDPIVIQTGEIIWKLISVYDIVDRELALMFTDKGGHQAVIDILAQKDGGPSAAPYLKIINGLCGIPGLVNTLINAGLPSTIKAINDKFPDNMDVIAANFDAMKKMSNTKAGRDKLIEEDVIGSILKNLKTCADHGNAKAVVTGIQVLDNLCKSEKGKKALIDAKPMPILNEIMDKFSNDEKVLRQGAKLYAKICTEDDMRKQLRIMKECSGKIKADPSQGNIEELKEPSIMVANLMLVEDIGRIACEPDNLKMLIELFEILYKIDLNGKDAHYIKTYVSVLKYFMVIFQRIFNIIPDCYDEDSERGKQCLGLFNNIDNSIKATFECVKTCVEKLEKEGDPEKLIEPILSSFKTYFAAYADLFVQNYRSKHENEKKDVRYIEIITYILENIIIYGDKYFSKAEKANYGASCILKVSSEIVNKYPDISQNIKTSLPKTVPYMKNVIKTSDNYLTIKNDLDVCYDLVKGEENDEKKKLKEEIVPVSVEFMEKKPKFRAPNKTNLDILETYLTPEFLTEYFKKPDPKVNPNFALNYVDAIDSVMVKAFYESSVPDEKKEEGTEEEEEMFKEEYNEELEKEISEKGSILLKKVIDMKDFLKEVENFKKNAPKVKTINGNPNDIRAIEKNLIYQQCAITIKELFDAGAQDDFVTLKELVKREISDLEQYKRAQLQSTDNKNYKEFQENCANASKRIRLELALLKKLEDSAIKFYNETKDEKYLEILRNINALNIEVIEKCTENPILIEHIEHLSKNIPFIKENEDKLKTARGEGIIEKYINSLMNLLRKSGYDDDKLCDSIIKTLIVLVNKKPETCNLLVKAGCPRQLLQIMEATNNNQIARNAMELLKTITLSNQENLIMVANQNILIKLFEVRAKFSSDENITRSADLISNEIMKLPGQEKNAEEILIQTISKFHEDSQKDFNDTDNQLKLLNELEIINAFTSNKKQTDLITNDEFMNDLTKTMDNTLKQTLYSRTIGQLLVNEMTVLRKMKDNLPKDDSKHEQIVKYSLTTLLTKSTYSDALLLPIRTLNEYIKDEYLYKQYLENKLDEKFIEQLFEISEIYSENPEITKEINNLLCNVSLRNPKLGEYIVQRGGLTSILEELKATVNLNDEYSKQVKLNALKMLSTLLQDQKNMDKFIAEHGVDLINNIVKNEVNIYRGGNKEEEGSLLKTRQTINTKTPEQRKEDEIEGISTIKQQNEYFVHCLKIYNQGIKEGRKEFIDNKVIKNLLELAQANYPDRDLFIEIVKIITQNEIVLEEDIERDMKLIKLALDYKSEYYNDEEVNKAADTLVEKLGPSTFKTEQFKKYFKESINSEDENIDELNKKLTYYALISNAKGFDEIEKENKDDIVKFYKRIVITYKKQVEEFKKSGKTDPKDLPFDEGTVISLMTLTDNLMEKGLIDKDEDYYKTITDMGSYFYKPDNYNYVQSYNKLTKKLLKKYGEVTEPELVDGKYVLKATKPQLENLNKDYNIASEFIDYQKKQLELTSPGSFPTAGDVKDENLDEILTSVMTYYKTNPEIKETEDKEGKPSLNAPKTILRKAVDLSDTYKKNGIGEHSDDEDPEVRENYKRTIKRIQYIWQVVNGAMETDETFLTDPENTEEIISIIDKIEEFMKLPDADTNEFRKIVNYISTNTEGNDAVAERIYKFILDDYEKNKNDPEIAKRDLEIISNLSQNPSILKQIIKNETLWKDIKEIYADDNIPISQRRYISIIMRNVMKSPYNVEYLINNDPEAITLLKNKILLKSITGDKDNDVAQNEIEAFTYLINDPNNYKILIEKKIITEVDLETLEKNYSSKPDLLIAFNPVKKRIIAESKTHQEENAVKEDEEALNKYTQIVTKAFNEHSDQLKKLTSGQKPQSEKDEKDVIKKSSKLIKKKMTFVTGTLVFDKELNESIESPLSIKNNKEIPLTLEQILAILRKTYTDLNTSKEESLAERRKQIILKCLTLLKNLSLAPDNHRPILEGGLLSFCEKLGEENEKASPDQNGLKLERKILPFNVNAKAVLQDCSHSDNAVPLIVESPVLESTIKEVTTLYNHPEVIDTDEGIKQIFLYDNIIFSNCCKNQKGFEFIFNTIGLEQLILLGKKTGNAVLLEAIVDMLINYLKGIQNKNELSDTFWGDVLTIINKCYELDGRTPSLISKTHTLISLIWLPKLVPYFDKMDIIKKMNEDFPKFKSNLDYLNSTLNCLSVMTADNSRYSKEVVSTGLVTKLKDEVSKLDPDDNTKMIYNLTKLYYSLVLNNMENVEAFCDNGIVDNTIFWLDNFNNKLSPPDEKEQTATLSKGGIKRMASVKENILEAFSRYEDEDEEEKDEVNPLAASVAMPIKPKKNLLAQSAFIRNLKKGTGPKKETNQLNTSTLFRKIVKKSLADSKVVNPDFFKKQEDKFDYVRGIMDNSIKTLDQVTISKKSNTYLSKTKFSDSLDQTLKNKNHMIYYITIALHTFGNYLYFEAGDNIKKLNLEELYQLLVNLQKKYYANSDILANINYICGAIIKNIKDKSYIEKFFVLINESTKCQDWNVKLVIMALRLMLEALKTHSLLSDNDYVYDDTVPNLYNLLDLYKNNAYINLLIYRILAFFAKNKENSYTMINSGLFVHIKDSLENSVFDKKNKNSLKNSIITLLSILSDDEQNASNISDDLMIELLHEIEHSSENDDAENLEVAKLLNKLLKHNYCAQPFTQYKGIETVCDALKREDDDPDLLLELLRLLTTLANQGDEYKVMMQNLKVPDVINTVIQKAGMYEKMIEYEGRFLIFLINMAQIKSENVENIDMNDIKVVTPIEVDVKDYLVKGQNLKLVKDNGDLLDCQLMFSPDLTKIHIKVGDQPLDDKLSMKTNEVVELSLGNENEVFEKIKGGMPNPENCFTMKDEHGTQFNIYCEDEKDAEKLINSIDLVITFFNNTHTQNTTVETTKGENGEIIMSTTITTTTTTRTTERKKKK